MLPSRFLRAPLAALLTAAGFMTAHAADLPQVEMLIRGSADFRSHYDYVTWAPAPAEIRIVPGTIAAGSAPITVVLTNADAAATGRGHVNFAADALAYRSALDNNTPGLDTITMTLPADGTPQKLVVAGAFPYFSREDKDAAIVIHQGTAQGPVLATTRLMVRVRRNEETMSAAEKERFLWALAALRFRKHAGESRTELDFMVHMHDVGASGFSLMPKDMAYPDQEHKAAGFLPWHRAFLLELERDLQRVDPSVTLPYWPMTLTPGGEAAVVFHSDFTGANNEADGIGANVPDVVRFDPGNPLYGWDIAGQGPLMRWSENRRNVGKFTKPGDLIEQSRANPRRGRYAFAAGSIESNPHNIGHGWSGIWMSNCSISPSDPMFWPFHTYFDWLWAAWQQHYGRLNRDGKDVADYWPNDHYQENSETKQIPLGHHLLDTMWPWNEETLKPPYTVTFNSRRPAERVGGKFAAAGAPGLWPAQDAQPTPGDMIDYGGYSNAGDDIGVAYDNIPWSPRQAMPPFPSDNPPDTKALATLLDSHQAAQTRSAAAEHVDLAEATDSGKLQLLAAIAQNAHNPPALRLAALEVLTRVDTPVAVETSYRMQPGGNAALRDAIAQVRHMEMFANRPLDLPEQPAKAAPAGKAVKGIDGALYSRARDMVPDNMPVIVAELTTVLEHFLAKPREEPAMWPQDAVAFIAATNTLMEKSSPHSHMAMRTEMKEEFSRERTLAVLRKLIAAKPVKAPAQADWWRAKGLAALALAWDGDSASVEAVERLAQDRDAPLATRVMALNGLRGNAPASFEKLAFAWAGNEHAAPTLRAHAIASIGAYATDKGVTLAPPDRARLAEGLEKLGGTNLPPEARSAYATAQRLVALVNPPLNQ
ncbi:MAG TPA: tyrosinase family protein [Burkholderiaceae bacterium]